MVKITQMTQAQIEFTTPMIRMAIYTLPHIFKLPMQTFCHRDLVLYRGMAFGTKVSLQTVERLVAQCTLPFKLCM
jgi:hypothetical protein